MTNRQTPKIFNRTVLIIIIVLLNCIFSFADNSDNAKKPEKPRELTEAEVLRVEGYMNYLSYNLYRYYCIYGSYPISFQHFLDSGLIAAWPINPLTEKPVRVIRTIRDYDYEYTCEISYINDSADKGYFAGIFQVGREKNWRYMTFPETLDKKKYLKLKEENPQYYSEEPPVRFAKSIVSLFPALMELNLKGRKQLPESTEQLLGDDFRILREYYNPVYTESDENTAGFYELGVDLKDGFWYTKYQIWPPYTHKFALKFPNEGMKLNEREFVDNKFPKLSSPMTLLSAFLYPGIDKLPEKILMSKDEIEFVK